MKKSIISTVVTSVLAYCLFASTSLTAAPLAPGKPAGVAAAQLDRNTLIVVTGGAALIAGLTVLITENKYNDANTVFSAGTNNYSGIGTTTSTSTTTGTQ